MADTVQDLIRKAAAENGVPPALALAVAEQESGFNPTVFGPEITVGGQKTRAVGTFQLLPSTAKTLGVDPMDPRQNIVGGVKYLRQLLDQHQGDLSKVLGTYGGVVRDTKYVPGVLARVDKFKGQVAAPTGQPTVPTGTPPAAAVRGMLAPSTVAGDPQQTPLVTPGAANPEPPGLLASMAAGFDPRTTEGRIGLGATGAGLALAPFTGGATAGVLPWVARVLGPPVVAAVAGGGVAAAEQQLGTAPEGMDPLMEGAKQGAYEVGGRLLMWPIRRTGSAILGSRIGKQATEAVTAGIESAKVTGRATVSALRTRVQEGLDAARSVAEATRAATVTRGRAAITATRRGVAAQTADIGRRAGAQEVAAQLKATEILADVELANSDAISTLTRQYDNLLAGPPSATATGQLTREAVQGPAKRALDMAGQRVAEVAQSGPMINVTPLQAALDEMASKARPASLFPAKELPKGIGFLTGVAGRPAGAAVGQRMSREEFQRAIAGQLGVDETHPLPGVLGQLQQVKLEQLPFQDIHRLKMLLDEAVNWDRPAKKHLEKITKGLRMAVRDALSVHEPYNVATAAYQSMVPLYRRGVGKQVITAAMNNPDQIARTLKPDNPAQAMALKDLLVTQSAAGGDAQTGQRAWDHLRSAFTYNHVIKGGVDGLADRVHKLVEQSPEFAKVIFDDEPAQKILSNLDRLGQSFQLAQQQAAERVAGAKATGKTLVESAKTYGAEEVAGAAARGRAETEAVREAARQAVTAARRQGTRDVRTAAQSGKAEITAAQEVARMAVAAARAQKAKLKGSSIGSAMKFEDDVANVLRAVGLGPRSLWGALSIVRLMESPKGSDLVEWAAYSDQNTQRMVAALTGTLPDRAMAGLIREAASVMYPPTQPQ
jgi:hypothetical protein